MLHEDQHNEQQNLVDDEEPTVDAAKGKHDRLHRAHPDEVVKLVSTDRTERDAKPPQRCLHETEPTTCHKLAPKALDQEQLQQEKRH